MFECIFIFIKKRERKRTKTQRKLKVRLFLFYNSSNQNVHKYSITRANWKKSHFQCNYICKVSCYSRYRTKFNRRNSPIAEQWTMNSRWSYGAEWRVLQLLKRLSVQLVTSELWTEWRMEEYPPLITKGRQINCIFALTKSQRDVRVTAYALFVAILHSALQSCSQACFSTL